MIHSLPEGGAHKNMVIQSSTLESRDQLRIFSARLAAASSALLRALALRSGDFVYSDIADQASAPVNSRIHMRFSAVVSVSVAAKCHSTASGATNVSAPDVAKSAVFGVSKPRMLVNTRPARPSRLSAPEMAVTQRGTAGGHGKAEFILTTTPHSLRRSVLLRCVEQPDDSPGAVAERG
jgi:hypothetical protein